MKAIPIPYYNPKSSWDIDIEEWGRDGRHFGWTQDVGKCCKPDAGFVFFLIPPVWISNCDDKYSYYLHSGHIYKRFTNEYKH